MRTSTRSVRREPTAVTSPLWSVRSSFACSSVGMSPISSRKSVPPEASRKRPGRASIAPVKAPRSWPNSSLSSRSRGIAAELTATKGPALRALAACSAARDQLLAGAALAGHQHRHVAARHAPDGLEGLEQGRAAPDQPLARRAAARDLAAQRTHLALERARTQRLLDQRTRLLGAEGLGQVVERAALHGLDGVLEGVLRRHDDHGDVAAARLHVVEEVEAGRPGHAQVEEGHLELAARERGERLVAARRLGHLVAGLFERLAQHEADAHLVVGHQHTRPLAHGSLRRGSVIRARVPTPFSLSRCRLP